MIKSIFLAVAGLLLMPHTATAQTPLSLEDLQQLEGEQYAKIVSDCAPVVAHVVGDNIPDDKTQAIECANDLADYTVIIDKIMEAYINEMPQGESKDIYAAARSQYCLIPIQKYAKLLQEAEHLEEEASDKSEGGAIDESFAKSEIAFTCLGFGSGNLLMDAQNASGQMLVSSLHIQIAYNLTFCASAALQPASDTAKIVDGPNCRLAYEEDRIPRLAQ